MASFDPTGAHSFPSHGHVRLFSDRPIILPQIIIFLADSFCWAVGIAYEAYFFKKCTFVEMNSV